MEVRRLADVVLPQDLGDWDPCDVSPENDGRSKLAEPGAFDGPPHERTGPMKRSKFSEEQVAYALRQAESGTRSGRVPAAGGLRGQVLHVEEEVRSSSWRRSRSGSGERPPCGKFASVVA